MKLKIVLIALAFLLPVVFVHAEDGLTQCFDYYKFGSVQVDIAPVNRNSLAGTDLVFNGNVRNTNNYPIVDGAVYIKIFRKTAQSNVQTNGWELVDQFFAQKDIHIDSQKQQPISFTWKTPAYAVGGDYKAASYFVTQDRFNLSGLSFTDDITGTVTPFKIKSEQSKTVTFDKNSVNVNDKKFMFAAFTPKVLKSEDVDVTFSLKNEFAEQRTTQVTYTLYSWDGLRNEKIIDTKKETVTIPGNGSKALSYKVTDNKHPVYYLVVESKSNDVKSIIDVRFARENVEEPRLNFPAVNTYPLKQGVEATMFSCFHNSGLGGPIQDGKVVMNLIDGKGKQIDTYTYEGEITGRMMGVKKSFIPTKDYGRMTLVTDLYVGSKLIETSRSYYECEKLNPDLCVTEALTDVGNTSKTMMYVVIALALLVLAVAIFAYHGHFKRKDVGVVALLFASTLGIGMYQIQAKIVDADILDEVLETTAVQLDFPSNAVQDKYLYFAEQNNDPLSMEASNDLGYLSSFKTIKVYPTNVRWGNRPINSTVIIRGSVGYISVNDFTFMYTYGAEMRDAVTDAVIADGATVPANTRIKFVPTAFSNSHAAWFLSGGTLDSPYAYWDNGAGVPQCQPSDKFATQRFQNGAVAWADPSADNSTFVRYQEKPTFDSHITAYLPMVITKPNVTVTLDPAGTTAKVATSTDGTYTVTSPGTITGVVTFAPTTGKAYFQYTLQNLLNAGLIPIKEGGKFVDFAPGQEAKLATIPVTGGCNALSEFEFPLKEQKIIFTADVDAAVNKAPNAPSLILEGDCINSPTNIKISEAIPKDPNAGDTVTYDYEIDYGTGYGATQNTSNIGTSVTFTTLGAKKVRVRARDNGNLTSAWVEESITMRACNQIAVYCTAQSLPSDNKPVWTANVYKEPSLIADYTLSWSWPSRGYTLSDFKDSVLTSTNEIPRGSTWPGPSVTMTATNGTVQTIGCGSVSRTSTGSGTVHGVCTIDNFDQNIPTWKAIINNGRSPYTRTWYQNGVLIPGETTNSYTFPRALNVNEKVGNITSKIDAANGTTGMIQCPEAEVQEESEHILLSLKGANGKKVSSIEVRQNEPVDSFISFAGVTNTCTYSPDLVTKLTNPALIGNAGPSQLVDHDIDTSRTGLFNFNLRCTKISDGTYQISNNVQLKVIANKKLEEI